jgi:hypothetical protein
MWIKPELVERELSLQSVTEAFKMRQPFFSLTWYKKKVGKSSVTTLY